MSNTEEKLLLDLLVMQSTQAMSDEESRELERLLKLYPEYQNYEFDQIASLTHMSYHLNDRLSNEALPLDSDIYHLKESFFSQHLMISLNTHGIQKHLILLSLKVTLSGVMKVKRALLKYLVCLSMIHQKINIKFGL